MPITKSAKKKLKADKSKATANRRITSQMKTALKTASETPTKEAVLRLYSTVDVAFKKKLLKRNTAARLKAKIVKLSKLRNTKSPFAGKKTK